MSSRSSGFLASAIDLWELRGDNDMKIDLGNLNVSFRVDPPGLVETSSRPDPRLVIHFGAPVNIRCERGGLAHRGVAIHGGVGIIPAGVRSQWTLGSRASALVIDVSQRLLREAAMDLAIDPSEALLVNRFMMRDAKLEHLAWALKAEMDDGLPTGRLYTESIATAMACQLLREHSTSSPRRAQLQAGVMAPFRLRRVLSFIEDNLNRDLSLSTIAAASGHSISHCQRAFCRAMGVSVHQYVIRRRVERANNLLANTRLSLSEVALAAGFTHQSHMALQLRRLLGVSPARIRNRNGPHGEPTLF
jgi:AraC family transcriptional regulator